jgi:hypothetical protein
MSYLDSNWRGIRRGGSWFRLLIMLWPVQIVLFSQVYLYMIQDNLCVEKLFLCIYRCVFSLRGIPREDLNQKLVLHLCHEFQGQYEEMEHGDNSLLYSECSSNNFKKYHLGKNSKKGKQQRRSYSGNIWTQTAPSWHFRQIFFQSKVSNSCL